MLEVLPGCGVGAGFDDALFDEVDRGQVAELVEVGRLVVSIPSSHLRELDEVAGDPAIGFAGDLGQIPLVRVELSAAQYCGRPGGC
ncbi:hypothetical protein [Mycolicibacterium mageritense]|uniref:hypothetical protein n=1 Tax=Mycolicibacterium mageritense TaxID=53462 RepID=UPI001E323384|nr:hypothetical protein [Mycolicibacterium mageritense]